MKYLILVFSIIAASISYDFTKEASDTDYELRKEIAGIVETLKDGE